MSPTNIFTPASTAADSIFGLSVFVVWTVVAVICGRLRPADLCRCEIQETKTTTAASRAQIYGSTQVEMAWTIIPVLIVIALFLASARVIAFVQDAPASR